ncbi:hypothetical protein [uncultured Mailhella sp.]|uniref:capsular polysaccharide export protein, LipB/KpsS family n=1 Tax=uncultured Mailhella sp. TaxID=1981031 RepID=UPI00320A6583
MDSDSQVRRYSPFSGIKEAIAWVMASFAKDAPKDMHLVIRNLPLDSGLIRCDLFIRSFSEACDIKDRLFFVECGNGKDMIRRSRAVILLNSTMGMQALEQTSPEACLSPAVIWKRQTSLPICSNRRTMPDSTLTRNPSKPRPCSTATFPCLWKWAAMRFPLPSSSMFLRP